MLPSNTPVPHGLKLFGQVRDRIRVKNYSIRAETQYVQWVRRFILFHGKRHPREMGAGELDAFLSHLAVDGKVATATQSQRAVRMAIAPSTGHRLRASVGADYALSVSPNRGV